MSIHIETSWDDIRTGRPRDMDCCPVAYGLNRATGDSCRVFSQDGLLFIEVGSQVIEAPESVRHFVEVFDDFDDDLDACIEEDVLPVGLHPFGFDLPDLASPEWKEQCADCEGLFAADELDEYGLCDDCRRPA